MGLAGVWDVAIKTPIGSLQIEYHFAEENGVISGSATGKNETVTLTDIAIADEAGGQRVTWRQTVTKPMRLKLEFDVLIHDDQLRGHSRAGRLPRSSVEGLRRN